RERTGLEIRPAKPLIERIEDHKQLPSRCTGLPLNLPLQPGTRPELFAAAKKGQRKIVLGRVVPIEGLLRNARAGDNRVHPYGSDAVPGKELIGGPVYALSRGSEPSGLRCHGLGTPRVHGASHRVKTVLSTIGSFLIILCPDGS